MLVTIHGYYGYGNLGDDLMLYLLIEQLQQRNSSLRFRVLYQPQAEPGLIETPAAADVELMRVASWRDRFAAVQGAKALVFGGGTCLHRFGFCGLYNNLAARCVGVPVVWLGVGADEVGRGKTRLKAQLALKTCAAASWRDQPSADLAAGLVGRFQDSLVAEDLAFLLADSPTLMADLPCLSLAGSSAHNAPVDSIAPKGRTTGRTMVVAWRDFQGYLTTQQQVDALKHGADAVAQVAREGQFNNVRVMDVADLVDHEQNAELAARLANAGINVSHDVGLTMVEKIKAIATSDACIFARLHGLFLAKLLGKPAVAVGYAAKLDHFGKLFDAAPVVPLREVCRDGNSLKEMMRRELSIPSQFRETALSHAQRATGHLRLVENLLGLQPRQVA